MVIALKTSTTTAITYTNCCGAFLIMSDKGIAFEWFRDEVVEQYHGLKTKHVKTTDFENWLIKEQFKTIEELKEIYDLLPDGEYKGEAGDCIVRAKQRIRRINLKLRQVSR